MKVLLSDFKLSAIERNSTNPTLAGRPVKEL